MPEKMYSSSRASPSENRYWPVSVMLADTFSHRPNAIFSVLVLVVPTTLLGLCCSVAQAEDNVCLIDKQLGYDNPANVYQCKPPKDCCFEYSKPSCCGSKPSWQIIQEQLTLWGGLFAILLAIASIVYCRKNDLNVPACVALKHAVIRLCCGTRSNEDDTEQTIALRAINGSAPNNKTEATRHGWRSNVVNPMPPDSMHIDMSRV